MADTAPPQTTPQDFHLASDATGLTLHIPPLPDPPEIALWLALAALIAFLLLWKPNRIWIAKRWQTEKARFRQNYVQILITFGATMMVLAIIVYLWQIPILIGRMVSALRTVQEIKIEDTDDIRSIGYTFAALAGMLAILATIPFQLVRVWINERTAATQEANLTTGLINTAVQGLGAEKQVSRIGRAVTFSKKGTPAQSRFQWERDDPPDAPGTGWRRTNGQWQTFERTTPNIEVRTGAILTLDRIARENPEEHIRVMDILCAYVRENAPAKDAKDHPYGPWPDYPENPTAEDLKERRKQLDKRAEDLDAWVVNLPEPRTDIQTALTTLGNRDPERIDREEARFTRGGEPGYRLDLRETNLRKCDLSHLNLNRACLVGARLEGADLRWAQMQGAVLSWAQMQGAVLVEAQMERADLRWAQMQGAVLGWAQMQGADLGEAQMQGADLSWAQMQGADLQWAQMQGADLRGARMEGAVLREARMEGAVLSEARLQFAKWASAHTASPAQFADFRGARDLTQAQLDQMIGNAQTLLPDGPAPDTNQPFSIPSCWTEPPAAFVAAEKRWGYDWDNDPEGYRCPLGQEPKRTGTPLALDAPYPEGHPLAERDEAE